MDSLSLPPEYSQSVSSQQSLFKNKQENKNNNNPASIVGSATDLAAILTDRTTQNGGLVTFLLM